MILVLLNKETRDLRYWRGLVLTLGTIVINCRTKNGVKVSNLGNSFYCFCFVFFSVYYETPASVFGGFKFIQCFIIGLNMSYPSGLFFKELYSIFNFYVFPGS